MCLGGGLGVLSVFLPISCFCLLMRLLNRLISSNSASFPQMPIFSTFFFGLVMFWLKKLPFPQVCANVVAFSGFPLVNPTENIIVLTLDHYFWLLEPKLG